MIAIIQRIIDKAFGHSEIRKLLHNFSWLTIDRVIRLGVNLIIVAWMARYLGREQYGILNYAMSFTVLVGSFASFGMNNIVIREVLRTPERTGEILGSAFAIRQVGGIMTVVLSVIAAALINSDDALTRMLIFYSSLTYLFCSLDVIDLYFQSQIKSKYAVIAYNIAFLLLSGVRVAMILLEIPLAGFVIAATAEVAVAQAGMVIVYRLTGHSVFSWKWNLGIARELLRDSWPLMLSIMSTVFYLRIGQVMLGKMVDYQELGDYSAAVKISELWYFIPALMTMTIYPKIIEYKKISSEKYAQRLQEFFSLISLITYSAILPVFFLDKWIITLIFGEAYVNAGAILSVHIWAGLFVGMGVARDSWCNVENLSRGVFYSTLAGAVINILLNIPLIQHFGGIGSAFATMIARIVSGYLSTFFISKDIFIMQTKSLYLSGLFSMFKKEFLK